MGQSTCGYHDVFRLSGIPDLRKNNFIRGKREPNYNYFIAVQTYYKFT